MMLVAEATYRAQARMARCEEGHTLAEGLAKAPCSLMPEAAVAIRASGGLSWTISSHYIAPV